MNRRNFIKVLGVGIVIPGAVVKAMEKKKRVIEVELEYDNNIITKHLHTSVTFYCEKYGKEPEFIIISKRVERKLRAEWGCPPLINEVDFARVQVLEFRGIHINVIDLKQRSDRDYMSVLRKWHSDKFCELI